MLGSGATRGVKGLYPPATILFLGAPLMLGKLLLKSNQVTVLVN